MIYITTLNTAIKHEDNDLEIDGKVIKFMFAINDSEYFYEKENIKLDELIPDNDVLKAYYDKKITIEEFIEDYKINNLLPLDQILVKKRLFEKIDYSLKFNPCIVIVKSLIPVLIEWFSEYNIKVTEI